MKKISDLFNKIIRALSHSVFVTFLLVLPVGYYPDSGDSSDINIGIYGGHGQVASVIRDCAGNTLHSESSEFSDVSGVVYYPVSRNRHSVITIGLKGGYWSAPKAGFATRNINGNYGRTIETSISYSYINPNISFELKKIGFGIGYLNGLQGFTFDDFRYGDDIDEIPFTGHVRLGKLNNYYFLFSLQENLPLASGGGYMNIGLGYGKSESVKAFTGLSFGFYESAGFVYQVRFKTKSSFDFDFSLRLGSAGGKSETAISVGVLFKIGGK